MNDPPLIGCFQSSKNILNFKFFLVLLLPSLVQDSALLKDCPSQLLKEAHSLQTLGVASGTFMQTNLNLENGFFQIYLTVTHI